MIEDIAQISAWISQKFYSKIFEILYQKEDVSDPQENTLEIISTISIGFYHKFEKDIKEGTTEDWIHIFQNSSAHDFYSLIEAYTKNELLNVHSIDLR